jgi:hypothetical protein
MWSYTYEIDKRTKEKVRKIIWKVDKPELPSIETEIKDSSISVEGNNLPHEENKGEIKEAKRKKREKK